MKKTLIIMLIVLNFSKIYANDNFFSCLKNSKSNSQTELLIYYKSDCPHCIKMENEINKNINFQTKMKELYLIKLIDVSTIAGKKNAYINNVTSVPFIIQTDIISNKKTFIKGFKSVEKLESDLTNQKYFSNNSVTGAICGNGIIEAGETCDDGNLVNGDGCESNCTLTGAICGNGIIEAGETCDDGNLVNGDGCESNCTSTLGVNENETKKKNLIIIPNPTKNFIQIQNKLNSIESFEYKIFDLLGRIIKSGKSKYNEQINIESLTNGNYIIQIEMENGEKSAYKIIKN